MSEEITKPKRGRGRPKGTTAYVAVTMQELQKCFKGAAYVPVSREFALEHGLEGKSGKVTELNKLLKLSASKITAAEEIDAENGESEQTEPITAEEIV